MRTSTKTDKRGKERLTCGTCRWYDTLGDICRNGSSPCDYDHKDPRDGCGKWESDS